jgi:hypothetical protein
VLLTLGTNLAFLGAIALIVGLAILPIFVALRLRAGTRGYIERHTVDARDIHRRLQAAADEADAFIDAFRKQARRRGTGDAP